MNKIKYLLLLLLGNLAFSQYMIVGKDSVSLQDFKKDNLYGLQNAGIEKTLKNTQDFLLLQQLAEEKKADTAFYFRQRIGQKMGELQDRYFFPQHLVDQMVGEFVNSSKTERNILIFSLEKKEGDKTDYQKVYNDVVSGKVTMENAVKTYMQKEVPPIYLKPGIIDNQLYDELSKLQPGGYTKLYNNAARVTFAKLVNTRPSLGFLVFGSVSYPNDANAEAKKNEIFAALKSGKKFQDVTKEFGSTEHERKNGGIVLGSPSLPDNVYNAFKGKRAGEYTEPVLFDNQYYIFNIYDLVPYEVNEKTKPIFKKEMLASRFSEKLKAQLVTGLKNSASYKAFSDFETIKKSHAAFQAFKNTSATLYQFNKHKMVFGDLKKQISEQFQGLEGIQAQEWSQLMDLMRDNFVFGAYSQDFEQKPEVKSEMVNLRKMIFSEYIFSEYLKKEIAAHPEWLTDYYNKNKSKYIWDERAQGRVAIIADEKLLKDVEKQIKNPENWEALKKKYDGQLNAKNQILVHFEEGKMDKDADVFLKNKVPFKKGVYTTTMGERTVVIAVDAIVPPTQMTQKEASDMLNDAVTEQKLQETVASQRAKTKIVVQPEFLKDLEKNFKK